MHTHTASSSSSSSTSSLFSPSFSLSSSASTSTSSLLMASPESCSPPSFDTLDSHIEFHGYKKAGHGLWFDDGNLVLVAQDTAFRIYRGLLCARSSVFKDMFEFPPPKEGNDVVEGVPVVQTYDSALDMTTFLRAVLDSHFFEPPPSPTNITILESILRLSHKYDVPHLRLRAQSHLLTTYPTTLTAWRARDSTRTIPSIENTPFIVLNLAREFDMPWLIPSVAYCISSHDISKTLDGAEWRLESQAKVPRGERGGDPRGVGRRASTSSTTSTALSSSTSSSSTSTSSSLVDSEEDISDDHKCRLSWSDIKMCIKGRNNILLKQNTMALQITKGFPSPTLSPAHTPGVATPVHVPVANPVPAQAPVPAPAPAQGPVQVPAPAPAPAPNPPNANANANPVPNQNQNQGVQTPNPNPIPATATMTQFTGALPPVPAHQIQQVQQLQAQIFVHGGAGAPGNGNVWAVNNGAANVGTAAGIGGGGGGAGLNGGVAGGGRQRGGGGGGGCATPETCMHTRHRCAEMLTRWGTAGFLDFFDEQYSAFAPNLCSSCVTSMKTWCQGKSEEMWEGLPRCFGFGEGEVVNGSGEVVRLSPWEELERVRGLSERV